MCAYMYVYVHVCMCFMHMYICENVCMSVCLYIHTCAHIHKTCTQSCTHTHKTHSYIHNLHVGKSPRVTRMRRLLRGLAKSRGSTSVGQWLGKQCVTI